MFKRVITVVFWASLVLALSGAKKADEDGPEVRWHHPYLKDHRFDYDHGRDTPRDPKDFKLYYESLDVAYEFTASRETIYTLQYVLHYKDVDLVPQVLYLDTLDSSRQAEVVEFEATFASGGLTEALDASRLQEVSADADGDRSVYGDTRLGLVVPRHRPGILSVKLRVRQAPRSGVEDYFAGRLAVQRGPPCVSRTISFTAPALADRHLIEVRGDEPVLRIFEARSDGDRRAWTGTVSLTVGDYLRVELRGVLDGARGADLRGSWLRTVAAGKAKKGKKTPDSERDRAFVRRALGLTDAGAGTVEAPNKAPTRAILTALYSRRAELLAGDGVRALTVPLPFGPHLSRLVLSEPRIEPIRVYPMERTIDLLFHTPGGYTLAGLPEGESVTAGPLDVSVAWSEEPEGARMKLRYAVGARHLSPDLVGEANRAVALLRAASRPTLLYLEAAP